MHGITFQTTAGILVASRKTHFRKTLL